MLAECSALEAAEWWLKHDPNGAHACLAEYQGIGKYAGIDPAVHGPALLQSFNRAAQYAEVGKQVAAFQIEHRLTNSALRRMTEAINSGACEATLEAAYNHVMSRSSDPTEYEEWLRGRRPGPTHLFGATKQDKPRVARESNPWGFSDRPSKGF